MAKAEVNLNWLWAIDYGLFSLYIYVHGQFSSFYTNALAGFMISLCLAAPAPRVRRGSNLTEASVPDWLRFFLLFAKCFSDFRSDRRNTAVCKTLMLKKYFNSWKKYFLVWYFIGNQVFHNFRVLAYVVYSN